MRPLLFTCLLAALPASAFADVGLPESATPALDRPVPVASHVTTTMGDAFADEADAGTELRVLIQTRYGETYPDTTRPGELALAQHPDGWVLNRAFLRVVSKPTTWLNAKLLLDFAALRTADLPQSVKLAYATIQLHPRIALSAGLFKRPFSLLELLPIGEYEFGDNGPSDNLIKDIGFGGRDIGALVEFSPLPRKKLLKVSLGAFQGGHADTTAMADGLLAARVESTPWKHLHLGADAIWRRKASVDDYGTSDGAQSDGWAWSADVILDYTRFDLRAEVLAGDRTDVKNRFNPDFSAPAMHFLGAWILGLYRIPVGKSVLMPGLKLDWVDTDREHPVGNHLSLSGSLNIDFDPRVRLLLDLTHQWVDPGTMPLGKKPNGDVDLGSWKAFHDVDYTRFVVQLQVRI